MVHITDILPTLARLAGVQETFHTDGYDIWDAVRGVAPFERDTVVYNLDIDDQSPNFQFAIRVNKWKLFWGQRGKFVVSYFLYLCQIFFVCFYSIHKIFLCQVHGRHEHVSLLYNLARDPGEETDVSGRHPEKVAALQERVTALLADMRTSYQPNRYRGACFCDTSTNNCIWGGKIYYPSFLHY